ncbi:hypothetical protein D3C78_687390 [compost metagenome]
MPERRGDVVVFLLKDEGDHLRTLFAEHQQLVHHARAGQVVFGAALEHSVMAKALCLRDDPHAFEVYLANVRGQVCQGLQRLLASVDHVAEVEQRMQTRMIGLLEQAGDFIALELFMLLEVEVQVVQVSLLAEVVQVAGDGVHDLRQRAFVARVHADVAGADGIGHGDHRINVRL